MGKVAHHAFTDGDGLEQIDLPVSAQVGGTAGLWVGGAAVTSVNQYLKSYAHADQPTEIPATNSAGFAIASLPTLHLDRFRRDVDAAGKQPRLAFSGLLRQRRAPGGQ